mmetsp:Transcript_65240/g.103384  ORF Transcript_65240/g.103384 Transcript_65240/m.103384 type:complete len:255 (+) Transcript_65240:517-1281(+)
MDQSTENILRVVVIVEHFRAPKLATTKNMKHWPNAEHAANAKIFHIISTFATMKPIPSNICTLPAFVGHTKASTVATRSINKFVQNIISNGLTLIFTSLHAAFTRSWTPPVIPSNIRDKQMNRMPAKVVVEPPPPPFLLAIETNTVAKIIAATWKYWRKGNVLPPMKIPPTITGAIFADFARVAMANASPNDIAKLMLAFANTCVAPLNAKYLSGMPTVLPEMTIPINPTTVFASASIVCNNHTYSKAWPLSSL